MPDPKTASNLMKEMGFPRRPSHCIKGCGEPVRPGSVFCVKCAAAAAADSARYAEEKKRWEKEQKLRKFLSRFDVFRTCCDVDGMMKSLSISDPGFPCDEWSEEALKAAREWDREGGAGLWLVGGFGSGKSTIAMGLARKLINEGVDAIVANTWAVSERLKQLAYNWNASEDHQRLRDSLQRAQVLILDDFWQKRLSRPEVAELFAVVDRRWSHGLPIIVTANATKEDTLQTMRAGYGDQADLKDEIDRVWDRTAALAGDQIPCFYPGSRRTGFDPQMVPMVRFTLEAFRKSR